MDIDADGAKRHTAFEFHPVKGRRFLTIDVTLEANDIDSTATLLRAIAAQGERVKDAIVRLNISVPAPIEGQIRDNDLREALKAAHYLTIARDIQRETRLRLGRWAAGELTPLDALKAYLEAKKTAAEQAKLLLEYGEKLILGRKES